MKNRKFIGSELESCGWHIETYVSQIFENDLHTILLHLEKERMTEQELYEGNPPELFKMYLGKYITIETMVILDHFANYLTNMTSKINLLWGEECRKIDKCKGFVKFDKDRLTQVYNNFKQETVEL